jgi:integrase
MAAKQQGSLYRLKDGSFGIRFRDETGAQKRLSSWKTERAATKALDDKLEEIAKLRRGETIHRYVEPPTLDELVDEFIDSYVGASESVRTLTERLRPARKFGDPRIDRITVPMIRGWLAQMTPSGRYNCGRSLRQVLNYAIACKYIEESPFKHVKLEQPDAPEFEVFSDDEIEKIVAELLPRDAAIVHVLRATAKRPEELVALERRDLDRDKMEISVNRVYVRGELREYAAKTRGSRRQVPITEDILELIDSLPPRLDTKLLFPSASGGYIHWGNWRNRVWKVALASAGVPYRSPYCLRHTAISNWIADGMDVVTVAKIAGTSIQMIDRTYGRVVPGQFDVARKIMAGMSSS